MGGHVIIKIYYAISLLRRASMVKLAQKVNFKVKGGLRKLFLNQNGDQMFLSKLKNGFEMVF